MSMIRARLALGVSLLVLLLPVLAGAQTKLLRFPDIHGDKVAVLLCRGHLDRERDRRHGLAADQPSRDRSCFPSFHRTGSGWRSPASTTVTSRCTWCRRRAECPRSSRSIRRAGRCRRAGATTTRCTAGRTDGKAVLFRSCATVGTSPTRGCTRCRSTGGLPEPLPMPVSGAGDFSPDGKQMVYSPLVRDFRTWKRYEGGWAQDLYIFDLKTLRGHAGHRSRAHRPRPDVDR